MSTDTYTPTEYAEVPETYHQTISRMRYSGRDSVWGTITERDLAMPPRRVVVYDEQVSPDSGGGRKSWNDFEHYKLFGGMLPCGTDISYPTGDFVSWIPNSEGLWHKVVLTDPYWRVQGFFSTDGFVPTDGLPPMRSDGVRGFIPEPPGFGDLLDAAVKRWTVEVKSRMSIVNSLLEIGDIISLKRSCANVIRLAPLFQKWKYLGEHLYDIRKVLMHGSDWYLQAQFNLFPLVDDVMGIKNALAAAERRARSLINGAGRPRTFHFDANVPDGVDGEDTVGPYSATGLFYPEANVFGPMYTHRYVTNKTTSFHVEIQYNYSFLDYQVAHAQLLVFLDMIGANLNPKIIWNAIPWSFVFDWVFGVAKWLDQFKVTNMDPQINIRRCLWSYKKSRLIAVSRSIGTKDSGYLTCIDHLPIARYTEESYRRSNWMPGISSITSSGLSPKEISLGAALVFARRPRFKRYRFR